MKENQNDQILTLEQSRIIIWPVILFVTLLAFSAFLLSIVSILYYAPENGYQLTNAVLTSGITLTIFTALTWSAKRYTIPASALFTLTLLFASLRCATSYGVVTPQAMLGVAIAILCSGILLGKITANILLALSTTYLIVISFLQITHKITLPEWSNYDETWGDTILFIITFFGIAYFTNVFSRENKRSLERALVAESSARQESRALERNISYEDDTLTQHLLEFRERMGEAFHDVANPISGIALATETLLSETGISPEEQREIILSTSKNAELACALIHNLREEISDSPQSLRWFSIGAVLEELREMMSYKLRAEGVILTVSADRSIYLYGSPLSFSRIVKNLVQNSSEAYAKSNLDQKVIAVALRDSDKQIELTIHDSAGGIPESVLKHIFSPRFSSKNNTFSGIGLNIVQKKLQHEFRGNIFTASKGNETTFTITINKHANNITSAKITTESDTIR